MRLKPELSIVIPTLNEEGSLQRLLASLALQKGVEMEVIVSDGGSEDSTCKVAEESGLTVSVRKGGAGRALQQNTGAVAARGKFILFLHADSSFSDRLALRMALDALCKRSAEESGRLYAGHFILKFRRSMGSLSFSYRYLEKKAKLDRKGCSHGDQGILLPAELFRECGGFDGRCHILAETRFADRLREHGQWLLLPAEITTSPRRFEKEGVKERQMLNAVIMVLGAVEREELLDLSECYTPQHNVTTLQLSPIFRKIEQGVSALGERERADFWEKVGVYVCENAWQISFWADVMINRRVADREQIWGSHILAMHDRYLQRLAGSRVAVRLAAWASRRWLRNMAG